MPVNLVNAGEDKGARRDPALFLALLSPRSPPVVRLMPVFIPLKVSPQRPAKSSALDQSTATTTRRVTPPQSGAGTSPTAPVNAEPNPQPDVQHKQTSQCTCTCLTCSEHRHKCTHRGQKCWRGNGPRVGLLHCELRGLCYLTTDASVVALIVFLCAALAAGLKLPEGKAATTYVCEVLHE